MVKPVWTTEQIVANLDRENIGWIDGPITYAFLNGKPFHDSEGAYLGYNPFNATQRAAAQLALSLYSDVANVTFTQGADTSGSYHKITFANSSTMPSYVWGWTEYEVYDHPEGRDEINYAEVWVRTSNGGGSYANGTYNFLALMHEVGHTLGLSHPGNYNANGSPITYENNAEYAQDSKQYTVMSYFDASNTGANHGGQYASTLLLHDVVTIQSIYGANMTTRADDTVYGFHSTAGRAAYDFTLTPQPVVAIWDGGGIDTIDLSGYASSSVLDLNEGAFSNVGGLTKNLAICFGATIENAVGGPNNDIITGNAAANIIDPGDGDDWVYGGEGDDTVVMDGAKFDGADQLFGGSGFDTLQFTGSNSAYALSDFEVLRIVDGSAYLVPAYLNIPVIRGSALAETMDARNVGLGPGQALLLDGDAGNDTFYASNGHMPAIEGGLGTDTLIVSGDFSAPPGVYATLDASGIETVILTAGFDYALRATDAWSVDGSALGADDIMAVYGNDLAAGSLRLTGGLAGDSLYGGALADTIVGGGGDDALAGNGGDDVITGSSGNDTVETGTGTDTIYGGYGNEIVAFGASFTAMDRVIGGGGHDAVVLAGDYSGGIALTAATMVTVEKIILGSGFSYDLALDDGNIAANKKMTVDGAALETGQSVHFHGETETNGRFALNGGAGNDVLTGGAQKDTIKAGDGDDSVTGGGGVDNLTGGPGLDTFAYLGVPDSNANGYDRISKFDGAADSFDLWFAVAGLDVTFDVRRPSDIALALDAAHFAVGHAVIVTIKGIDAFLVADANGVAGYQAGEDLLVQMIAPTHVDQVTLASFV